MVKNTMFVTITIFFRVVFIILRGIAERLHYILSLKVAKYNEEDTSISFGFFNPNNGTVVTGGDIHIYDAPVETIKIVGK